nr:glycosyltransferase family 2 protein [Pigmentibacter ruber]
MTKLSVVTTLYKSELHIYDFYRRINIAATQLFSDDFEIIFVNDGSPDRSLEIASSIVAIDKKVQVINLSRNFGHHKAIMTGLSYAKGNLVFLIDSDLEEEPELLLTFYNKMNIDNCDVVYGVQNKRKGDLFEQLSGKIFFLIFNLLSKNRIPVNLITARLMTSKYVKALLMHKEKEIVISGLWVITGFQQNPVLVNKLSTSKSSYTFIKKVSLLINSITSFSEMPLYFIFYSGIAIFTSSLIFVFYLIMNYFYFMKPFSGWTSVIASIWLLGGIIISFIGLLSIYISKIFIEVKNRPFSIVKDVIKSTEIN